MDDTTRARLMRHTCESGTHWSVYDAQGIYLCRVCEQCEKVKLSRYRPEILTGYNQSDVDEPIDNDEGDGYFY